MPAKAPRHYSRSMPEGTVGQITDDYRIRKASSPKRKLAAAKVANSNTRKRLGVK